MQTQVLEEAGVVLALPSLAKLNKVMQRGRAGERR